MHRMKYIVKVFLSAGAILGLPPVFPFSSYSASDPEPAVLYGRVLGPEGIPVADFKIHVMGKAIDGAYGLELDAATRYLGSGQFKTFIWENGAFALEITAPGLVKARTKDIDIIMGITIEVGDIVINQISGSISGQIYGVNDRTTLNKIMVTASVEADESTPESEFTDKQGRFKINNLLPGVYKLQVVPMDFSYKWKNILGITVSAGETKSLPPILMERNTYFNALLYNSLARYFLSSLYESHSGPK